jgi:hypothetical protein
MPLTTGAHGSLRGALAIDDAAQAALQIPRVLSDLTAALRNRLVSRIDLLAEFRQEGFID